MKQFFLVLCIGLTLNVNAQNTVVYNIKQVDSILRYSTKPVVLNFWATFCEPCVKELPHFNDAQKKYLKDSVQFFIVSVDVKTEYPNGIDNFLKKLKVDLPSVWLSDNDPNIFIPAISGQWEGSIPATMFVHNNKKVRFFYEGELNGKELNKFIKRLL